MSNGGGARKNLPEALCSKILYQLLNGIAICHSMLISHRGIKLENILVDTKSDPISLKIIDFGFSRQSQSETELLKQPCGTLPYMAPELCKKKEYLGPPADMWAIGVVFYTLLFG